jgi:hypothetical protein
MLSRRSRKTPCFSYGECQNATCILNEDKTGEDCKYLKFGEYNENDLEDKETIVGFVQY